MKKFISVIAAASMFAAAASAVFAETEINEGFDEVVINNNFDDCENTGAPDGSNYAVSDGNTKLWDTSAGFSFSKNYYASVDFMLPDENAAMNMGNKSGKSGPKFSVSGTSFRNETGSNKYAEIYDNFQTGKWYKLVLEGRMTVTDALTNVSLYEYDDEGNALCVVEPQKLNLRNFYSGSPNGDCGYMTLSEGICYDNEYVVQLNPNEVTITESENRTEVTGGGSLNFTAAASRNTVTEGISQPKFTWSVEDVKEEDKDNISISDDGYLSVSALTSEQDIVVAAEANSFGNPRAEYAVHVNAYNLGEEKFDRAEVIGEESITAGESASYSFKAYKGDKEVTEELSDGDYLWEVYDSTGTRVLGNKYISIDNGTLMVDKSVLAQNINVRVMSPSTYVYSDCPVSIKNSDTMQTIINTNAFEEKPSVDTAELVKGSWDGSSYYRTSKGSDFIKSGTKGTATAGGDIIIEADLKFDEEGAGITTMRNNGGEGLFIVRNNNQLKIQTGGSSYKETGYELDASKWYHIELLFNTQNPSLAIWEYDESGEKVNKAVFGNDVVVFRNSYGLNRIKVNSNTSIDNYIEYYPMPDSDSIEISAENTSVSSGGSIAFTVKGSKDGMVLNTLDDASNNSYAVLSWSVYDSDDKLPVEGENITINTKGVMSVKALTPSQSVNVHVVCKTSDNEIKTISIPIDIEYSAEVFEITGIATNDDDTKIVRLYVDKTSDYNDSAVFFINIYRNGRLIGSTMKETSGDAMNIGANEIAFDFKLEDGFNPETDEIKAFAWTSI